MKLKILYLIRHGTVHNPGQVVYRRLPGFRLSERGHLEAEETRDFLAGSGIEVFWHSPLERALETAEIVNQRHSVEMIEDARIHEWGEDEGPDDVRARMEGFLEMWRDTDYAVSAAVSHRDPIRRLLAALENPEGMFRIDDPALFPLPQAGAYCLTETEGSITARLAFVPSLHSAS